MKKLACHQCSLTLKFVYIEKMHNFVILKKNMWIKGVVCQCSSFESQSSNCVLVHYALFITCYCALHKWRPRMGAMQHGVVTKTAVALLSPLLRW